MPRYTFHLDNGHRITGDEETLPNVEAARRVAEQIARDMSKNRHERHKFRIVVTDETGAKVVDVSVLSDGQ